MYTDRSYDTIEELDAEIQELEARICRLRTRRNALALPSGLPEDIIVSILSELQLLIYSKLDLDRNDVGKPSGNYTWIQSTHICGHWRRAALNTPRIWGCLEINAKTSLSWIRYCLARAGRAPLSLHVMIISKDKGPSKGVIQHLIHNQCLVRIQQLTIHNNIDMGDPSRSTILNQSWQDTLTPLLTNDLPSLCFIASNLPENVIGPLCPPSLQEMTLHEVSLRSWKNTKEMPMMHSLTSLEIRRKYCAFSPEEILNLLHCMPQLRRLRVSCGDGELEELSGRLPNWPTVSDDEATDNPEAYDTLTITIMKRFMAVPKHLPMVHLRELKIDSSLTFLVMMLLTIPLQQLHHLSVVTRATRNIWRISDDRSNYSEVHALYQFIFRLIHAFWVTKSDDVLPEAVLRVSKNEAQISFYGESSLRRLSFCVTSMATYDHYSEARLDPLIGSIRTWIFDPVKRGSWRDPLQGGVGDARSNIASLVVDFGHSRFSHRQVEEVWKYLKFRVRCGAKRLKILRLILPGGVSAMLGKADREKSQNAARDAVANDLVEEVIWMADTGAIIAL